MMSLIGQLTEVPRLLKILVLFTIIRLERVCILHACSYLCKVSGRRNVIEIHTLHRLGIHEIDQSFGFTLTFL